MSKAAISLPLAAYPQPVERRSWIQRSSKIQRFLPTPFRTEQLARKGWSRGKESRLNGPIYRIWKLNKCSWINEQVQFDFICSLVVPDLHNIPWDRPLTHHMLTPALPPHDSSSLKSITTDPSVQTLGREKGIPLAGQKIDSSWVKYPSQLQLAIVTEVQVVKIWYPGCLGGSID